MLPISFQSLDEVFEGAAILPLRAARAHGVVVSDPPQALL